MLDIRSLNENFLNPRDGSSTGTTDSVLPESYIQTEIKILSSDSIRNRAVKQIPAPQAPAQASLNVPFWQAPLEWVRPARPSYAALIADAGRRVKIRNVGNTRIVEVLCGAQDGQLAAAMCNTLSKTYIENNLESRYKSTKETSDWLQSQLDDVRRRLTKAENDFKDVSKNSELGLEGETQNPAQEKLRVLQGELSRTDEELISKESSYAVAASRDAESLPVEMDSGLIREYRAKLADLRRQLRESSATMTPEHYHVRELQMQVDDLETALKRERDGLVNRLRADLEMAERRESSIAKQYQQQARVVSEEDGRTVHANMIKRDVDSERRLYETLLQKVGEVGLAEAMRTSTISVIDPAVAPLRADSPNLLAETGIGLFAGTGLGLALAFVRTRTNRTLRSPGESVAHIQIRELGVIPSVRRNGLSLLRKRTPLAVGGPSAERTPLQPLAEGETLVFRRFGARSIALGTWLRIPEVSEAFHGTMNSLLFATEEMKAARTLVVTSPETGDGKTTVATNLAIALAQIGRRVVLVDGDLRCPSLHTIFHSEADHRGLADLLDSGERANRPLREFFSATEIPNLTVLTTRPASGQVAPQLHSEKMRSLMAQLREHFDQVIVDSPPMLHVPDARVLGWLSDGILLVFRAGKTTREAAISVTECLGQDGIRVLGTVLNDWNPRKGERYAAYIAHYRAAS